MRFFKAPTYQPTLKDKRTLWGTSRYFEVLLYTLRYFYILWGTSRYFEVLLDTLKYFYILWGTSRYFEVISRYFEVFSTFKQSLALLSVPATLAFPLFSSLWLSWIMNTSQVSPYLHFGAYFVAQIKRNLLDGFALAVESWTTARRRQMAAITSPDCMIARPLQVLLVCSCWTSGLQINTWIHPIYCLRYSAFLQIRDVLPDEEKSETSSSNKHQFQLSLK